MGFGVYRVWGLGFIGFGVKGLGFRVVLGFQGLGFRGLGFRAHALAGVASLAPEPRPHRRRDPERPIYPLNSGTSLQLHGVL